MYALKWLCRAAKFGCVFLAGIAIANHGMAESVPEAKASASAPQGEQYQATIELAINGDLPLDAEDAAGRPVLITAIVFGNDTHVQRLLEKGHDPNTSFLAIPALFFAVTDRCEYNKLQSLLSVGGDANIAEPISGSFPLHFAAQHQDVRCLEALIEHGAVPSAVDGEGQTAYFYAVDFANESGIQRLWEAGVDPMTGTWAGMDIFEYAALMDRAELLQDLLPTQR